MPREVLGDYHQRQRARTRYVEGVPGYKPGVLGGDGHRVSARIRGCGGSMGRRIQ